jgi:hypothetical protein
VLQELASGRLDCRYEEEIKVIEDMLNALCEEDLVQSMSE